MNREQAKDFIKGQLESYLTSKGINTRKNFNCLNPEHNDNNPSMSFDSNRNKAHCFSCGADYDTFDIIGIEYGLREPKDMFKRAYELFNLQVEGTGQEYQRQAGSEPYTHNSIHTSIYKQGEAKKAEAPAVDYTGYFLEAHKRLNETDYPEQRGLSRDVIEHFNLGYEPRYTKGTGGEEWSALIIPTGKGTYIARNTDPKAGKNDRYRKQGGNPLYNTNALTSAQKPVFIVEGELDALSVITAGGEAVALGSTANSVNLLRLVKVQRPTQPLFLALDNDTDGKQTTEELEAGLKALNIPFYSVNPYGNSKDANEALLTDRETFITNIAGAERMEEEAKEAEKKAYLETSAASHLQSFIDGIADSVNTPYIPTGFPKLDLVLEGGLYEGLYFIGAISSLGKTTFITQIADQIAQQGTDVLIFSLEMARAELMAKSISRHTMELVLTGGGEVRDAKTNRGITTGKRYPNYSQTEINLINEAVNAYGSYAQNIYIHEGIGDIGTEQIRATVAKHILFTGKTPLVVVDYLQILDPNNERATDKQNTDKAVMELKRISRDYKLPLLAISSFNRANYKVAVTMEAFKESGAVEYSSDILMGLQLKGQGTRDFDVDKAKDANPREIELVILKNRNGPTGRTVPFEYYPLFNLFAEGRA